jgi:hypothetical protein
LAPGAQRRLALSGGALQRVLLCKQKRAALGEAVSMKLNLAGTFLDVVLAANSADHAGGGNDPVDAPQAN